MAFILALFAATQLHAAPVFGGERCAVDAAPETGIGILCERARMAIAARELSVARRLAKTASDLAPSHPGVWIVRAEAELLGRQAEKARSFYEKAAELEPSNPALLVEMGDFEAREGNVRGAAVLYEKAAALTADYPGLAERLEATRDAPSGNEI